ncbi:MAG TPA: hypothetical protein VH227_06680 [Candidatus Udaeobacter sp.]|jgi:hypothetical protein|nr:hypothetical protein [Candidatus Udaeobacter sp.]
MEAVKTATVLLLQVTGLKAGANDILMRLIEGKSLNRSFSSRH